MVLKKLIDEITVHTGLLEELLQVLERETVEMGDVNITAMALSNQMKEDLIDRVATHSQHLQRAISDLAIHEGLSESTLLSTVAAHVARKGNRELSTKQQQLLGTAVRVQQVAGLNGEIAERFASSVTSSLSMITRLINQSNVYGASGGYQQRPAGAVMFNKEV